jgi:hypothetical protein
MSRFMSVGLLDLAGGDMAVPDVADAGAAGKAEQADNGDGCEQKSQLALLEKIHRA